MIQLYNDDCLNIIKTLEPQSIDTIICDLPYGTTKCSWDVTIPFENLWDGYLYVIKPTGNIVLFGQEPFSSFLRLSNLNHYRYDIYWEKERLTNVTQVKHRVGKTIETISIFYQKFGTYNPQMITHLGLRSQNRPNTNSKLGNLIDESNHTVIPYNDNGYRYPTQLWHFNRDILTSNLHPTQKPIELLKALVRTYSNENDTILDNCMGSGTTGVACKLLHRNFIGIEKDIGIFNIAKDRINNTLVPKKLL